MSMPGRNNLCDLAIQHLEAVEDVDGNHESASSCCFEEEAERNMNVSSSEDNDEENNDEELSNENALLKRKLDTFSDSGTKILKIELEKDKASCSQNEYEVSPECAMARFPDMEAFSNELSKFVDEDNQMDTTASDQTGVSNEEQPEASDTQRVMSKADVANFFRKQAQSIISSLAKPKFQEIQGMSIFKDKEGEGEIHAKSQASCEAISGEGMQGASGSIIRESMLSKISAQLSNIPSTSSAGEGEIPLSVFPGMEHLTNWIPQHEKSRIKGILHQQMQDVRQEIAEVNNLMNQFKQASSQFPQRLLGLTWMYEQAASKFDELN